MTNYKGIFKDWEIGVAKKIVSDFQEQWISLRQDDFEELVQDVLVQWYFAKDKYDESLGASEKTFMSNVVKNKLMDKVRNYDRLCRRENFMTISIDHSFDEDEDETLLDKLVDSKSLNFTAHVELKVDLLKVYQKLTPKQQQLCRLISEDGLSIQDVSRKLDIPRGTIYEEIKRIKVKFQKAKLDEYLK